MVKFELPRDFSKLAEITQRINNLSLKKSLDLSCAGYISMQIRNERGERIEEWTGMGRIILSRYEDNLYGLKFKNRILGIFDDLNLSIERKLETEGEWYTKERGYSRGIGAILKNFQEVLIYPI